MRRVLVAGGGTGGHVYPLLAVISTLHDEFPQVEICYLGRSQSVEERLVQEQGVPFRAIAAGGVRGMGPVQAVTNLAKVGKGVGMALAEVARFQPDVVLVTGGYVSVPVAEAAWLSRRPVVVCLPDMEPGLAVRVLARLARTVTVSFEEVVNTLPAEKVVVTGYPVRPEFLRGNRAQARWRLGVPDDEPLLVIFGGSSGARNINNAVMAALPGLLEQTHLIHITGNLDYERVQANKQSLGTCAGGQYRIYSYVENGMADLLRAADLVVARAGAATLGEFPAAGVPSVLVPGTFAGGHQTPNANYLRDRGAAVILEDADLQDRLLPTVRELLQDRARLAHMAEAARRLSRPQACRAIVAELQRAAGGA